MPELMGINVETDPILKWRLSPKLHFQADVLFLGSEYTYFSEVPKRIAEATNLNVLNAGCPGWGMWQIHADWLQTLRDKTSPMCVIVENVNVGRKVWEVTQLHKYGLETWRQWEVPPDDVTYRKMCDENVQIVQAMESFYLSRNIPLIFWNCSTHNPRNYALGSLAYASVCTSFENLFEYVMGKLKEAGVTGV